MDRLYRKSELVFSLVWMGLYLFLSGAADALSAPAGHPWAVKAVVYIALAAAAVGWIGKNGLWEKYGLTGRGIGGRRYLWFLPLGAIVSMQLWGGTALRFSPSETPAYILAVAGAGAVEELIFRGFLLRALPGGALRRAAVTALLFGAAHGLNLLAGADAVQAVLQMGYSGALGFLFAVIVLRSESLLPCLAAHGAINALSAFAGETSARSDLALTALACCVSLLYAAWILLSAKNEGGHL